MRSTGSQGDESGPRSANDLSLPFVEGLYADYVGDPSSVSAAWRAYFERFSRAERERGGKVPRGPLRLGPSFRPRGVFGAGPGGRGRTDLRTASLQDRVDQLVRAYRLRGHLAARLDPLERPRPEPPELDPAWHGLTTRDLGRTVSVETVAGDDAMPLRDLLETLRNTYCRSIGVQYAHLDDLAMKRWLEERMEGTENRVPLSREEQVRILTRLTDATVFEEFVRRKFVGAKSFSLEGAETLIPLLDLAVEKAGDQGVREIVLGMAHRGRLNVLANVLGKRPREIFREFADRDPERHRGRGDVKYHLGHSADRETRSGRTVHLSLCFNPSHLEFVNPVAVGRMRAKQDRAGDVEGRLGLALLIHGDAAFAGEGVNQETLSMSRLPAYTVGGTLHVVVNNQIGFTTPTEEGCSTQYATDVARMLDSPVFHVNGEDPEAVAQVVRLALDFRAEFRRDVFVDMWCYRRHGHNETDEPSFTQPLMYGLIRERKSVRQGYLDHLLGLGGLTREEADEIAERRRATLEEDLSASRDDGYEPPKDGPEGLWESYTGGAEDPADDPETGVPVKKLSALLARLTRAPAGFRVHPKVEAGLGRRREMARGERPLDWSAGEALAFATLAAGGTRVRLSGQDTARGTFSQRHASLFDVEDGRAHVPLQHVARDQAPVEIWNSPLNEAGVLAFEYGYSLDAPDALVGWEAQFGDFLNAGQVVVDQFLASAEDKWRRLSGLVLLLPHGFEGQGPEHSSARLERILALAAEDNLVCVQPTTPAQYFHVLRRQALRKWRKPLFVLTPKSLLRGPRAVSSLEDCAAGRFERVLADVPTGAARVLVCTGKIGYDLDERRGELGREDVAVVRLEQIHPFPETQLRQALSGVADGTPAIWVQDEPENMGAWPYVRLRHGERLLGRLPLRVVARPPSASPATGSSAAHKLEQEELLGHAFGGG